MITGMQRQHRSTLLFAVFCTLAGLAPEAQAYLDPSTGSMILSAIVGLFATIALALKTYWYKLRNLLIRRPDPAPETPPDATQRGMADSGQGSRPS
jgi:O-antigen/teichoic acid export membrane protein